MCMYILSHVQLFVTPWTVACQAPLSMGFQWDRAEIGDFPRAGQEAAHRLMFIRSIPPFAVKRP